MEDEIVAVIKLMPARCMYCEDVPILYHSPVYLGNVLDFN